METRLYHLPHWLYIPEHSVHSGGMTGSMRTADDPALYAGTGTDWGSSEDISQAYHFTFINIFYFICKSQSEKLNILCGLLEKKSFSLYFHCFILLLYLKILKTGYIYFRITTDKTDMTRFKRICWMILHFFYSHWSQVVF